MPIGSTIKGMFKHSSSSGSLTGDHVQPSTAAANVHANDLATTQRDSPAHGAMRTNHGGELPAGTGPGTSGKPAPMGTHSKVHNEEAMSPSHKHGQGLGRNEAANVEMASPSHAGAMFTTNGLGNNTASHGPSAVDGSGHMANSDRLGASSQGMAHFAGSTGDPQEKTVHLQPVTHDKIRQQEVEEITHTNKRDHKLTHIQPHTLRVNHQEAREEVHTDNVQPTKHIETHRANTDRDISALKGVLGDARDTVTHGDIERSVIDKGEIVNDSVHHDVVHVVQPVIEREIIDPKRIHTVIPTHEVIHEAPIVHQAHHHEPMTMEQFQNSSHFGQAISRDEAIKSLLSVGHSSGDSARNAQTSSALGKGEGLERVGGNTGVIGHRSEKMDNSVADRPRSSVLESRRADGRVDSM